MAWDWTHLPNQEFSQLVRNYGQFLAAHSAVDSPYAGLCTLLYLTHKGAQQIVLTAQYVGAEPRRLEDFARAVTTTLSPPVQQSVPVGYHHVVVPTTEVQRMPWLFAT